MTDASEERAFWDSQAHDLEALKLAIWAEPGDDEAWERDVLPCIEFIEPYLHLKPGDRVLDLGCGLGRLTIPMARMHPEVHFVGVDISPEIVDRAWEVNDLLHNLEFVVGNGRDLPDEVGVINAAYTMITFQHIPLAGVQQYLQAISNRLVPDGVLRFQFCVGDNDSWLQHDATTELMQSMCNSTGYKVVDVSEGNLNRVWGWITAVKL